VRIKFTTWESILTMIWTVGEYLGLRTPAHIN